MKKTRFDVLEKYHIRVSKAKARLSELRQRRYRKPEKKPAKIRRKKLKRKEFKIEKKMTQKEIKTEEKVGEAIEKKEVEKKTKKCPGCGEQIPLHYTYHKECDWNAKEESSEAVTTKQPEEVRAEE